MKTALQANPRELLFDVRHSAFDVRYPHINYPNDRILSFTHSASGSIIYTSFNNRFASSKKPFAANASARPHVAKIKFIRCRTSAVPSNSG